MPAAHANQASDDESAVGDHADVGKQALVGSDPRHEAELYCLALNIYFEARSEPESGQRAVGHVVMNRVAHSGYPDSVCEVVQQGGEERLHRCQFSWWCDGQSDRPVNRKAWTEAQRLAHEIYNGLSEDMTDGALWYHATYVKPYWSELLLKGDKIGQHIFYLEHRRDGETL
jgi:spore germination cell wall hydrolase CwlJ-like protein